MLENWLEKSSLHLENYEDKLGQYLTKLSIENSDIRETKIALIGLDQNSDSIRDQLYKLSSSCYDSKILDLGNLRSQDPDAVAAILNELLASDIVPILFGESKKIIKSQYHSQTDHISSSWLVFNESLPDYDGLFDVIQKDLILGKSSLKLAAYQNHMTSDAHSNLMDSYGIEAIRLGHLRQNIDRIEPWCRSIENVIFDVSALRLSDFPAQAKTNPGGLLYEEACKLFQFLGAANYLRTLGIYGYDHSKDTTGYSAAVAAQLIWYFLDGFNKLREERSLQKNNLTQYIVAGKIEGTDLHFWKSNISGRWWLELPDHTDHWVSCTYEDYKDASTGEFSSRLINVLNRA